MKLFITGGAGYIGAMLADQFAMRGDVHDILLIDKDQFPSLLEQHPYKNKIFYIQDNLSNGTWQEKVKEFVPDVIIHTAWQIRELYGQKELQYKWNIEGSDQVFDLAFKLPSVKKLIYFSSVSSYGAYPSNSIDHFFTEDEPFRKTDYLYAEEKRIAEEHLKSKFDGAKKENLHLPQVFVVRPASITGPRGRFMKVKFGLQSALSGQLRENPLHRFISLMLSFMPVTPKWLRQFIHEDDITNIVEVLSFNQIKGEYEVFNLCPPGPVVLGKDMAEAVHKKAIMIQPWMIRIVFFIFLHLSKGRIPTSKGGWKTYSYPIAVDGSKVTQHLGYHYLYPSKDAFAHIEGRYAKYVK